MTALTATKSYQHQSHAIGLSKDAEYYGLFMEQGTGKTHVSIATIAHLFTKGEINAVIVLAPNGVHDNWLINEVPLHMPESIRSVTEEYCWHSQSGVKSRRMFSYYCTKSNAELLIIYANIEALRVAEFYKGVISLAKRRPTLTIIDESTAIKNPKAITTKYALNLGRYSKYRRILTGTPITQGPLDLWAPCQFLSPRALPYPSWTAFKSQFAIEQLVRLPSRNKAFMQIIGYQNQAVLAEQLKPFTHRVLKKDCLDLPDKIYQQLYVDLTKEQKQIYKDLSKQMIAAIPQGKTVSVSSTLTLLMRLHQVTLGYAPDDGDGKAVCIPHNRTKALASHLEQNPGRAIIFCRFVEDIRQVAEVLVNMGKSYVLYYGDVGTKDRSAAVKQFQQKEVDYFISSSAGSKGLTLHAAEQVVYYSQDYKLETRLQSEDRAHRIGQEHNVVYTDIIARGTVDQAIAAALRAKKDLASSVIDRDQLAEVLGV